MDKESPSEDLENNEGDFSTDIQIDQKIEDRERLFDKKFYQFHRYHHPDQPLTRTTFQRIMIWLGQFFIILFGYYIASFYGGGLKLFLNFIRFPLLLHDFSIKFLSALLFLFFFTKLFRTSAVLSGSVISEILLEFQNIVGIQWALIGYLVWSIFWESRLPYRNGDYYRGARIFHQLGLSLFQICSYLIVIYYGITLNPVHSATFSQVNAQGYLILYFFTCNILWILPLLFLLWIMDRILLPHFPLTEKELELLKSEPLTPEDNEYFENLPKQGEFYSEILTHHPIVSDSHTIVLMIGKVRVYFCTRCSAMILGVFYCFSASMILLESFNLMIPPLVSIYLTAFLPLIPILDWGLQAIKVRRATTLSRLFSGMILGSALTMMEYAHEYFGIVIILLITYFTAFFILSYIRKKKEDRDD